MSVPIRPVARALLALFALPVVACSAATGSPEVGDAEASPEPLLGNATYTSCSAPQVRVFEEAHRRGRIAAMSGAFRSCLELAMTRAVSPRPGVVIGPLQQCPDAPRANVGRLTRLSTSSAPLAITCDPTSMNWGYAGTITSTAETFTLAATAMNEAQSDDPDLAELAATYWHEVTHDNGYPHCGDQDPVWVVDRCLGEALRAADAQCNFEDPSYCPSGLLMPERMNPDGTWSSACECVADNHALRDIRPTIPLEAAAAVQRSANAGHVFSAAHGGVVTMVSWSEDGTSLRGTWGRADDIDAPLLPDGAVVNAISQRPSHLDVFAADTLGRIVSAYWDEEMLAFSGWYPVSGEGVVPPGAPIAAISRHENHVDVFAAGSDGAIYEAWWNAGIDGGAWHLAAPITAAGVVQPGNELSVTARYPDVVNVFYAGLDGTVSTVWWAGGASFSAPYVIFPAGTVRTDAHVAAVARDHEVLDVFAVGQWGDVLHSFWTPSTGGFAGPYTIAGPGSARPEGSVTAYSRTVSNLDLYWITSADAVGHAYWAGGAWVPLAPEILGPVGAGASLAATTMYSQHLDVFSVDAFSTDTRVPPIRVVTWDERGGTLPAATPVVGATREPGRLPLLRAPRRATAVGVSPTQIEVSFADEEGTALRYEIRNSTVFGIGDALVGDVIPRGDTSTHTVLVEGLEPDTAYNLRVCVADGVDHRCGPVLAGRTLDGF